MSPSRDNGLKSARQRYLGCDGFAQLADTTTRQRLLQRAAQALGHRELAERLNVTPQTLDVWLRGLASMPDRKLLELAAILDELSDK